MFFYILLLTLISGLVLLGYFYPKKEKMLGLLIFAIIVFVSGFRYRVGGDYDSYVSWYLNKTRDNGLEFGFVAIMDLFRWLNLSPQFLFFFFSFFTCFFLFFGIKKYTGNPNFALLFFILIPSLYLSSFTLVRQSFSVAISFYAFHYLISKRYFIYFILMFIGVAVHNSCLIPFVVFLFVVRYVDEIKKKHLVFLLIFSLILSMFDFTRVFSVFFEKTRYAFYFSNKQLSTLAFKMMILKIIILNLVSILVLFYFDKLRKKYPYQKYLLVLYIFSVASNNIFAPLGDLSRLYIYFKIFEIIVVADLIFLETNRRRIILFSFFYVLYLGSFFNGLEKDFETYKGDNKSKLIPYKSVLGT